MSLGDRKAISEKAYSTVAPFGRCLVRNKLSSVVRNNQPRTVVVSRHGYCQRHIRGAIAQRCHMADANQLISAEWTNLQRGIVADWAGFAPVDE